MERYSYKDRDGDRLHAQKTVEGVVLSIEHAHDGIYSEIYAPTDPAELHKLTEAIYGREVAAIIYVDELPEVDSGAPSYYIGPRTVEDLMVSARTYVAHARHLEAEQDTHAQDVLAWSIWLNEQRAWERESVVDALVKAGVPVPEGASD